MASDDVSGTNDDASGWYHEKTATFGDRLAGAREAAGLSQGEFARNLGVKLKTVQNWENDLLDPRANKLQMMAGLLNVSIMWLLTGRGEGIDAPGLVDAPAQTTALLTDLRRRRADAIALAERLGRLEKRLARALTEPYG